VFACATLRHPLAKMVGMSDVAVEGLVEELMECSDSDLD
jgi:hypothetical protein